jgi:Carboxypeptidase regulatory-like domain/TonB dependent receptor
MVGVVAAQQQINGSLRGQVTDNFGAAVVGASVTLIDREGRAQTATTDGEGGYLLASVPQGLYTLRASAPGFGVYEDTALNLGSRPRERLDIQLHAALEREEVNVEDDGAVNTDPANNADALVLRARDLDALPDDPVAFAAALRAFAAPSAGPNGGQIYVDGFSGGRIPPRETIREVRISQNQFAAENDSPLAGRIDIFTKPGTDKLQGSGFVGFSDEALNSRNPFAPDRAPYQFKNYGATLSGTVIKNRASFFVDVDRNETNGNELVNAQILDEALRPAALGLVVLTPQRYFTFSPRLDYRFNSKHTLVGRYSYSRRNLDNQGISTFNLPERAYSARGAQHLLQLTETAIISARAVNETRFQYVHDVRRQTDDNFSPSVIVQDAFYAGGAGVGSTANDEDRYELQNYTTYTRRAHVFKFGGRLRGVSIEEVSPQNFGGTFIFSGGLAPQLDAGNQIVRDAHGEPSLVQISSLERYRRTLLFESAGMAGDSIRAHGGGVTQFTISAGNPAASVNQTDFAAFVQDDWQARANLSISYGLRYETQTSISSPFNFAPRLAFAYSTSLAKKSPLKTVIRGGAGIYYARFGENFTLLARRFDGSRQQSYIITDPAILDTIRFGADRIPQVPSVVGTEGSAQRQVTRRIADNLESPHSYSAGIGVEQQLPGNVVAYAQIGILRSRHLPRLRNINAPLPGTFVAPTQTSAGSPGTRPAGDVSDVYLYESSGNSNVNRLTLGFRSLLNRNLSLFGNYSYSHAFADVDSSAFSSVNANFPANSYDLKGEYARAFLPRHLMFLIGSISLPRGMSVNPFIRASSGSRFNILAGRDINGDGLFTDRPAFADEQTSAGDLRITRFGSFDLNPKPGQRIIPRNFGEGAAFFSVDVSISKRFAFGTVHAQTAAAAAPATAAAPARAQGGASAGSAAASGRASGSKGASTEKRYGLTLSIQVTNLFNRVNASNPVGNLSSPLFGQSLSNNSFFRDDPTAGAAGNRIVRAQLRLNF